MPMPMKGSRTQPTRGSMTPPLPSPPITAPTACIFSTTLASPTALDPRHVHQLQDALAVPVRGAGACADTAQLVPGHPPEAAAFIQLLHLEALAGAEDCPLGAEQFQAVPLRRVVTGGDLDASG